VELDPVVIAASGEFAAVRRGLHAHPETAYREHRTADRVAELLERDGIEVHRGIGGTGMVGVIGSGASGRSIALRADLDALPIREANTFAHVSTIPGAMHACGHDGHVAMLLLAAHRLAGRDDLNGVVHLVFQPAEEGGAGAKAMIEDGLFERFRIDEIHALHSWPGLEVGSFAVGPGLAMGSSSRFHLTITGRGGHAALPHLTIDPIPAGCAVVQALQTVVSRSTSPLEPAVVSVTQIRSGEAINAVPTTCEIAGTVRTATASAIDRIEQRMVEIAQHIAAAHGTAADFRFERHYPPTINPPEQAGFARATMESIVGADRVLDHDGAMTGEDFAFFLAQRPGSYAFIGNGTASAPLHSATYDFDDRVLALGATYWVRLAERFLS